MLTRTCGQLASRSHPSWGASPGPQLPRILRLLASRSIHKANDRGGPAPLTLIMALDHAALGAVIITAIVTVLEAVDGVALKHAVALNTTRPPTCSLSAKLSANRHALWQT